MCHLFLIIRITVAAPDLRYAGSAVCVASSTYDLRLPVDAGALLYIRHHFCKCIFYTVHIFKGYVAIPDIHGVRENRSYS